MIHLISSYLGICCVHSSSQPPSSPLSLTFASRPRALQKHWPQDPASAMGCFSLAYLLELHAEATYANMDPNKIFRRSLALSERSSHHLHAQPGSRQWHECIAPLGHLWCTRGQVNPATFETLKYQTNFDGCNLVVPEDLSKQPNPFAFPNPVRSDTAAPALALPIAWLRQRRCSNRAVHHQPSLGEPQLSFSQLGKS